MTLHDAVESLYQKYGRFGEATHNICMPGLDGRARMVSLMNALREDPPQSIAGMPVVAVRDYKTRIRKKRDGTEERLKLGPSNVLYFELQDGNRIIIRPSGTEPKVKIYILVRGKDKASVEEKLELYSKAARDMIK